MSTTKHAGSAPIPNPPVHEAGGVLTIDTPSLAANWRSLASRATGAECAGVVKADAYGVSIDIAAPVLAGAGCRTFFVAHLSEGKRVRTLLPAAVIYVLNGFLPGSGPAYAGSRLRPVLGSHEELTEWSAFTAAHGVDPAAALHVDTGINRLGLTVAEAVALGGSGQRKRQGIAPALVMSHFVSAERPSDPLNARQIEAFAAVRAAYPGVPGSLANSSGVFLGASAHHDLVRPGYALYGGNPRPGEPNPMRPVVRLDGRVMQVREIEAGATVGYNARWTARQNTRTATVSLGYADGLPGGASGFDGKTGAEVIAAGIRCPVIGRVSMDMIVVDISATPIGSVSRGDLVTLLDETITVDDLGARAGVIGYEILTSLGRRYHRRTLAN